MKATLLSQTEHPIKTVLDIWDASKEKTPLSEILDRRVTDYFSEEDKALFLRIVDQGIPVGQNIVFNFMLEDVPISWREQAVRHRVGVHFGDNYGVDIIPEMADSAFWSQSMRIQNMSTFADNMQYYIPESLTDDQQQSYIWAMDRCQETYAELVESGVPMEDARNLIPLGATHRISMTVNLNALKHIIGERGCWILQGGMWGPIIKSMVDELAEKVDPVFRRLVRPPCVGADNCFNGCVYVEENRRRVSGDDALPVCPLFSSSKGYGLQPEERAEVNKRIPLYADLWNQPNLEETWAWDSEAGA